MRKATYAILALGFTFAVSSPSRADEKSDAKAIVAKAIESHGGEAEMKKLEATTTKLKGTIHVMGMDIAFTGDLSTQGQDRVRVDIEASVMDQKIQIVNVFNKDKGWAKINDNVMEMSKDQIAEAREQGHASKIANLVPLNDKAYELSLVGEEKVGDVDAVAIRVSRKDYRDVTLFFDKKSHLLLKSESRVKDEATGQEVSQETMYGDYNDKGLKQPKKLTIKRDGKPYMEAEISDLRVDEKFDDSLFGKP
jgi:outer membrane lipoprotein-sorting protein